MNLQHRVQKSRVESLVADLRVVVIEHGLDGAAYDSLAVTPETARKLLYDGFNIALPAGPICLFVGSFNFPNQDAVTEIRHMARLLRAPFIANSVNFILAGNCCEPETDNNFVALGAVDEETLLLIYKLTDIVIVPLQSGTGASVKTIEALLYGKAVIGTPIGFRGYFVTTGLDAVVCIEVPDFPDTILKLLRDPIRRREIENNARAFAMSYQYGDVYSRYEQVILDQSPGLAAELPAVTMDSLMRANMYQYQGPPSSIRERTLRQQSIQLFAEQLRDQRSYSANRNVPGPTVFRADLDYPPSNDYQPRWGYRQPMNQKLVALFERDRVNYEPLFENVKAMMPWFDAIGPNYAHEQPAEPYWKNDWFTALEAALLYTLIVKHQPQTYLEIGSGHTTLFAARAKRDHNLVMRLISIDPEPRREIDALCDLTIRQGLETVDLEIFADLVAGDIVLVDSSHRVFMNSDVTVFMLDVLPILKPGVLIHFHDIFLPGDYPPQWSNRYYSEQYALGAWLLGAADKVEFVMPLSYLAHSNELQRIIASEIKHWPYTMDEWLGGTSLWFRKRP